MTGTSNDRAERKGKQLKRKLIALLPDHETKAVQLIEELVYISESIAEDEKSTLPEIDEHEKSLNFG